jgi:hypothetical protein
MTARADCHGWALSAKSSNRTEKHRADIHSRPTGSRIFLDSASYKLYYVNYEMKLNSEPVDCLCNPRETLQSRPSLLGCR